MLSFGFLNSFGGDLDVTKIGHYALRHFNGLAVVFLNIQHLTSLYIEIDCIY